MVSAHDVKAAPTCGVKLPTLRVRPVPLAEMDEGILALVQASDEVLEGHSYFGGSLWQD